MSGAKNRMGTSFGSRRSWMNSLRMIWEIRLIAAPSAASVSRPAPVRGRGPHPERAHAQRQDGETGQVEKVLPDRVEPRPFEDDAPERARGRIGPG